MAALLFDLYISSTLLQGINLAASIQATKLIAIDATACGATPGA